MPHQTTLVTLTYGDRSSYLHTLISRSLESPLIARVIIVSNASVAPLQALCDEWPDQVQVIRLPHNTGSAFGYATGIKAALEKGDEYIWLMDDDNAPTANAIEVLHRALHERQTIDGSDNCAVLGFRPTHQADIAAGVPLRYAIQRRSSFFGFHIAQLPYKIWRRLPWGKPRASLSMPERVQLPFATYGGLLAHRSLYEKIGLPLDALILYSDDTEYTWRITDGGGTLSLIPEALLDDLEDSWNIKARTRNVYENYLLGGSDLRAYYAARNQAWFDRHVWASSTLIYRLNRRIFLCLLSLYAWRCGVTARLSLLNNAIREGEASALGLNKAYPL
ncbi:Glycosyl transferase, group 2 family protein [Pseudomonas caricapapayae]|uniref:Glycosyl transferase, group 2 protein n=1 Tax=Pseudomonas caricapapayae TaxID=46678 RepID=A0A0P9LK13_9PSED|nr:glycosyltransferase [Pseudomonas caricapapayae]KAA8694492.1 glycosyltransferase [Pseudomonas caricapapayae]KPW54364.1 Glycosyl transferase, group 2 family protein [Pseudomonas caricapapayae]RMM08851.1 Glycosyl transferase, group 2 protein [Pseudomonas caricapapayae]RMV80141.1 Glycosyl transferase, group 2 protein [Pseudomonas caricapapayae]